MAAAEEDLTYWRHRTPVGVKVEEISGGARYSGRVWELMARQVWNENGRDGEYRNIEHTPGGAPLLDGVDERISLSHTKGLMVVATLPPTPEVNLDCFTPRAAMGVDAEREDRLVSPEVRERVFSDRELALIATSGDNGAIVGWTCKEALYKAVMGQATSWRDDYRIEQLPDLHSGALGRATVVLPEARGEREEKFVLYSYLTDECVVTIAVGARCATYKKSAD